MGCVIHIPNVDVTLMISCRAENPKYSVKLGIVLMSQKVIIRRKTMPVWHAIKGLQKGVVESKCERCGAKIRIWPGDPKVCVKSFREIGAPK